MINIKIFTSITTPRLASMNTSPKIKIDKIHCRCSHTKLTLAGERWRQGSRISRTMELTRCKLTRWRLAAIPALPHIHRVSSPSAVIPDPPFLPLAFLFSLPESRPPPPPPPSPISHRYKSIPTFDQSTKLQIQPKTDQNHPKKNAETEIAAAIGRDSGREKYLWRSERMRDRYGSIPKTKKLCVFASLLRVSERESEREREGFGV